ncbi:DNA-binding transcriptional regulator, FadR family [Devosia enhydra]|uniref:DNA-binding transcriptional regulator, FadR family n=1 Tax=Devosia enhydra TaxID=665118 RepID=A0A1K2HXE2_9HYPH|nr:FadR/GntR family transcriptional regulator [Devosia enhydra]SFZ84240.1 DNA-binding transcriptional regulator, FadR family [Devosia enhydra]
MAEVGQSRSRASPRPKLALKVAEDLRAQLLAGDPPAGSKLPTEIELTARFGVSRTVIREAIAALAADGFVEPRQGAGVFVLDRATLTFNSMTAEIGNRISHAINVLEVRMGIEIESAGLAAQRRNGAQEAAIQEAFFEFDRLLSLNLATGRTDFEFHRAIAAATNNPFYLEVLDALGERAIPCDITSPWGTESILSREYQEGLQVEHLAILRAISAGDADAARASMRHHLSASQQRYRARLYGRQQSYSAARAEPVR